MNKLAAASLLILLAGCGGAAHTAASSSSTVTEPPAAATTPSPAPVTSTSQPEASYGNHFLAIVQPINADLKALPADATPAQLDPLESDIQKAQAQLLATTWPAKAEPDVRTFVTDLGTLDGAVVADDNATQLSVAAASASTASATVRADLGLPSNL